MLCSACVHHCIHSRQSVHRIISGGSFTPIDNPSGTGEHICIRVSLNPVELMINISYQGSVCLWKFSLVHFSKILCGIGCNFLIYIISVYCCFYYLILHHSVYNQKYANCKIDINKIRDISLFPKKSQTGNHEQAKTVLETCKCPT